MKTVSLAIALMSVTALAVPSVPRDDQGNSSPPPGYYVRQKVVYQNDGGWPDDRAYFDRLMRNLAAHIAATARNVEIRVVNFASGVKVLQLAKTDATLAGGLDALRAKHVRFLICRKVGLPVPGEATAPEST